MVAARQVGPQPSAAALPGPSCTGSSRWHHLERLPGLGSALAGQALGATSPHPALGTATPAWKKRYWAPGLRRERTQQAGQPAAVAFASACVRDRVNEAMQILVGVWRSTAVALLPIGRGAGDLGGDHPGAAVVGRLQPTVPSSRARGLLYPRRGDSLGQEAADVGCDVRRIGPARRPLEQHPARDALAAGLRRPPGRCRSGHTRQRADWRRAGRVEVGRRQVQDRGGRGAEDPAGPVGQQRHGVRECAGVEDEPQPRQRGRAAPRSRRCTPAAVMPASNP